MHKNSTRRKAIIITTILIGIAVIVGGSVFGARYYYNQNLEPAAQTGGSVVVEITSGSTLATISEQLYNQGLIRNKWVFERYVRSKDAQDKLLAGVYNISPTQSVSEIVNILTQGLVDSDLVTILPGKTIDQIRSALIFSGFEEQAVDDALRPDNYPNHPALVDKPRGALLEGYLYPESFHVDFSTTPDNIIQQSLDEMNKRLTPEIRQAIVRNGLTVHEGIILASIVEREVNSLEDRKKVAQVFYSRLDQGWKLESDTTRSYGPGYDTYEIEGLTPTPISNITETSLEAVAYPADTDYMYFVTGEDCVNRFARTLETQTANIEQYGVNTDKICR